MAPIKNISDKDNPKESYLPQAKKLVEAFGRQQLFFWIQSFTDTVTASTTFIPKLIFITKFAYKEG
jgi:hypothetical protein